MQMTFLLRPIVALLLAGACSVAIAQNKYWIGGDGNWADRTNWSLSEDGPGGAAIPRAGEDVIIRPSQDISIVVTDVAWCRDLSIDASIAAVTIAGGGEFNIGGSWLMNGTVTWSHSGEKRLIARQGGHEIDLRGTIVSGNVSFDGDASWSVLSDLVIGSELQLKKGTLIGNASSIKAQELHFSGDGAKRLIANDGAVQLSQRPAQQHLNEFVEPGNSALIIDGDLDDWRIPNAAEAGSRDMNVCGTGPGQTPFIINATLVSNYNGFGVTCRGVCNGSVTVSVSGGVGPFTYQWLNSGPPSATWNSACGGPQIVIVTDLGQGISCPASVNVSEPAPLGVIFFGQGTPPTCADVCNGSRTALAVGGVSPHTYDWNNGAGTNSAFFELCAGLNTLLITDANACTFDTSFFFNIQPIIPNLTFSGASCYNVCDGSAQVAPTGGTGTFNYAWTPAPAAGQGTNAVSGLCAGNWSVTIADGNGCDTTIAFVIDEPPPIEASVVSADATCAASCDGSASIGMSGPGPFSFAWDPEPGSGQGTSAATGLCEGSYTILITDGSSGCDTLISVVIGAPDPIDVGSLVIDASCSNSCDGSISLSVSGGTPGFTYFWTPAPPNGQGTPLIGGLCAGTIDVLITDAAGCDTTIVFNIDAPPPLDPGFSSTDINCAGDCDGTANASPAGGTAPYTFLWTPAPPIGQGTAQAEGLCAGSYDLLITDANGCDTLVTFSIMEPDPLIVTASSEDVTCSGACDGSVDLVVSGGVAGYAFNWSPEPAIGQGSGSVAGLCAGSWNVVVTDANGCTFSLDVVIDDAAPLVVDLQSDPASCPGICDGSATAVVSGGTAPYSYAWSPEPGAGQGTANATGLCPQDLTLTITDALGCDTTISFTIDAPVPIDPGATLSDLLCADECTGSIALSPTGGNGTYTYTWSPVPPVGAGTSTVSGLCAGIWNVTIASGACDSTFTFEILAPEVLAADLVITPATCAGECDGIVDVTASGGTAPYSFTWTPAPGAGQGTPSVSGLCPGNYSLLIADAAGCDTTIAIVVDDPDPITTQFDLGSPTCTGLCDGSATITIAGGTLPYSIAWGPGTINGDGTETATDLCSGSYTVTVTDASGCIADLNFDLSEPPGIDVAATSNDPSCASSCDGTITITASGGQAPYTYVWSPGPPVGQGSPAASGLCAGIWSVVVSDALGCDTLITFDLVAPDPITPNSTSTNETCNGPCDGSATVAPTGGVAPYSYIWAPVPPSGQGTPSATGLCPGQWSVLITDAGGCDTTVVFDILDQQALGIDLATTPPVCYDGCDGSATVTVSNGIEPYSYIWIPEPANGQSTATATGLCAGAWQVQVSDALGCDTLISFNLVAPSPLDIDLVVNDESCTGPCTGSASVAIAGGTGTHTIIWSPDPINGQGTNAVTDLCAGTAYSVQVIDGNGCDTTIAFIIDPNITIQSGLSATSATCANTCDGTATAAPSGGVAPYTYLWSPAPATGQGTASATGFCAGTVSVQITDAAGCVVVDSVEITAPDPISDNAVVTDALCHGFCDGSIVVVPSGGVPPYQVFWSPVPPEGQGSLIATGLCMGNYLVQVIDANGCDVIFSHDVFKPNEIELTLNTTPSECQQCIGSASVSIIGGVPGYSIEWVDPAGNIVSTADTAANLCAGLYVINVTDANGCTVSQAVPIIDPDAEDVFAVNGITSCPGICDGTAAINFTCSDPPCTIAWSDPAGTDLGIFVDTVTGLCDGAYFAVVTNASGCVAIEQVNVVDPSSLVATVSTNAESCPFVCDASASIAVSGGDPPFIFTWDPAPGSGQGSNIVSGLCAGDYTVQILDAAGCITELPVSIGAPDPIVTDPLITGVSCAGDCNGSIAPQVSGGEAPYAYSWSPPLPAGPDGEVTGLCAGTYALTVLDANGCSIQEVFTIDPIQTLQLSASVTASTCPDCDGTAAVIVSGGSAPFNIEWSQQNTVVGTGESLTGLCGGLYVVLVTDTNGCSAQLNVIVPDNDAEEITPIDGVIACSTDCNGSVGVSFNCSLPPCTTVWSDTLGTVIAQDLLQVDGLCAGMYYVQVTNGSGCTSVASASITPSIVLEIDVNSVPIGCSGACDGSASVAVSGPGAFTYTWDPEPGAGQGTPDATGLCAGEYDVLISDGSGCDTTITVIITDPQPIALAATVMDNDCVSDCDGSISVIVTGGSGPFTFLWSPEPAIGQGTANAAGLCAGDYSLAVTDVSGCTVTQTWTLAAPDALVLTTNAVTSACGACSGTAEVTVSGGVAPYAYSWFAGSNIFGTDPQVSGLCAGIYMVLVVDANGCEATQLVPVSDVDAEVIGVNGSITSCPGICDGTAILSFDCGLPDCSIAWFNSIADTIANDAFTLSDLCAGTYYAMVTNANGCVAIDTALVSEPDPIIANVTTIAPGCFGGCDGEANVVPSGGSGNYTYDWQPAPPVGQGTPSVSGLCPGNYTVTITDGSGCSIDVPFTIDDAIELVATSIVTPVTCNAACDGSIEIVASGGTGPYAIDWSPVPPNGQGVFTATGLCAGSWSFTLTDANGCTTNGSVQLIDPAVIELDLTTSDQLCTSDCDGTAAIQVNGGSGPYEIEWIGDAGVIAQDVTSIFNLCAGNYSVEVIDANGCAIDTAFTIGAPVPIGAAISFTGETCNGPCDGSAVATASGVGPFTYTWSPEPSTGQGTDQAGGLCAGNWSVTITNAAGCDTTIDFSIQPYVPLDATATIAGIQCSDECNGSIDLMVSGGSGPLTYVWSPEPGTGQGTPNAGQLCAGEYAVSITDQNGCDTTLVLTIMDPGPITINVDQVEAASCATAPDGSIAITISGGTVPYSTSWQGPDQFTSADEDLGSLLPGNYSLVVTDAGGCTATIDVVVDALIAVEADAGGDQQICAGPTLELDASQSTGSTAYQWFDPQGNEISTSVTTTVGPFTPGNYTYTLVASDGPCSATDEITIVVLEDPLADAGPDHTIHVNASVALGGSPTGPDGSSYSWTPDSVLTDPGSAAPIADPTVTTWFAVTVTAPNGCVSIDSVLVTVIPNVVIPTGFTPNGDGWNDTWVIDFIDLFPQAEVEIYNRWGEPIFTSVGYKVPWDGRYNGGFVPVGTYYYVIKLNDPEFPEPYTGPLTVIR